jgi:hypothetical protein
MAIYTISQTDDFLSSIDTSDIITAKKRKFYNLPCSFDIETTSFYESSTGVIYTNKEYKNLKNQVQGEKRAVMYVWQFAICDDVIYGRTWQEFISFCDRLHNFLDLENNYLVVYVHNLSYEFQFMCKWFSWIDIFADSERKPIKAETDRHIIFKCSYRLSGYSLAVLAKNLHMHKIEKLTGDLDYDLLRNSETPLSEKELSYCFNDVLIVTAYISEQIAEFGNIEKIPLTQTGKVRRYVRAKCFKNKKYRFMIEKFSLDKFEYLLLKNAFAGGFTHCNAMYTEQICKNVTSYDFTSSYPTVLVAEKYPMSKGRRIEIHTVEELENVIKNFAVLVDVEFTNIKSSFIFENIISYSKCRNVINPLVNNGRIVQAEKLTITITDVDYLNIKDFYTWESAEIGLCYVYTRGYLPKEIIESILQFYNDKTKLKDVEEKKAEYMHSKELLNSVYGMCVTSIVHDSFDFDGNEWHTLQGDPECEIENYNKDKNRFLFYPWGVWCTAYARNNLYTGIKECREDYIYSDTDSVKIFNAEKHAEYFERYNKWITNKLEKCLTYYNLDLSLIRPETIKGIEKPLGVWDFDGFYTEFKTLGAKRYIMNKNDSLSITICGLSKKSGKTFIEQQEAPFEFFNNGMFVDRDHTGKMTHTYIDSEIKGVLIDYLGNECEYFEKSFIHLEATDYVLSLTKMYVDYYTGMQKLIK